MKAPFRILIIALILHLELGAADLKLEVPEVEDAILVSLPENHDPGKSWPAVFSYHGFNGRPETRMTRAQTGNRDWIVIGMAYHQRGKYDLGAEGIAMELQVFKQVRDQLARTQGLDPKRIYLTGYSKGGWMTDTLLQSEPGLAGGAILMGGHLPTPVKNPPALDKKTTVFIGVGRLDPNYLPSLNALMHYRGLGLPVSFEAWADLGHAFPKDGSPGLREWYLLQNGGKPDQKALEKEYHEALALPPVEAWAALVSLGERPFFNTPDSPWPNTIKEKLAELTQDPKVSTESEIRSAHRQLLAREVKMRTLEELRRINDGYLRMGNSSLLRAKEIGIDHRRIMAVLKSAAATSVPQPKPRPNVVEPELPENKRLIPRNPLVR